MANYVSLEQLCADVSNATLVYNEETDPNQPASVRRTMNIPFWWNDDAPSSRTFIINKDFWTFDEYDYNKVYFSSLTGTYCWLAAIYEETGYVGKYQYVRHRIHLRERTNVTTTGPGVVVIDFIFVSNGCIYINLAQDDYRIGYYAKDIELYYTGSVLSRYRYEWQTATYPIRLTAAPTTPGVIGTMQLYEGFDTLSDAVYLIYNPDNNKTYTYDGTRYIEITEPLSAAVFEQYGLTVLPETLPDVFKVYAYSPTNPSLPSVPIGGDRIIPSVASAAVCHITETDPYGFTAVHTDGDVYYSQDGVTWDSEDSVVDHSDYYVKVDNFEKLHSISVITEDTSA